MEVITASPLLPDISWVRNTTRHSNRGISHVAFMPLDGSHLGDSKARCGWTLGHIPTVVAGCGPPLPHEFFFVCKRCALAPRKALFESFSSSMKKSVRSTSLKTER